MAANLAKDQLFSAVSQFTKEQCSKYSDIKKILLFGSRARGDHHERSDFDFAIYAPKLSDADWSRFCLDFVDNVPTLCGVDLVRMDDPLEADFRKKIETEGVLFYGR